MVSYERGYALLRDEFDCFEIAGLHIGIRDNRVAIFKCLVENARKAPQIRSAWRRLRAELFEAFEPDGVITDFEPMTAYLARRYKLPLISVDNQHAMRYMEYECPRGLRVNEAMSRLVVRLTVPAPDAALITTFFRGEVKNDRTFLFPPILREDVVDREATRGEHIVVYHTREFGSFLDELKKFPDERFLVYGYNRDAVDGPIQFRKFSVEGFRDDVVSCKAVMATAGFTLLSEALHLRKPFLATPQQGQFEQELNACMLEKLGYGMNAGKSGGAAVGRFLERLPEFEGNLAGYVSDGNGSLKAKLGELVGGDWLAQRRGGAGG